MILCIENIKETIKNVLTVKQIKQSCTIEKHAKINYISVHKQWKIWKEN